MGGIREASERHLRGSHRPWVKTWRVDFGKSVFLKFRVATKGSSTWSTQNLSQHDQGRFDLNLTRRHPLAPVRKPPPRPHTLHPVSNRIHQNPMFGECSNISNTKIKKENPRARAWCTRTHTHAHAHAHTHARARVRARTRTPSDPWDSRERSASSWERRASSLRSSILGGAELPCEYKTMNFWPVKFYRDF